MKKANLDWFNEYQRVEDYVISLLGDRFIEIDLVEGNESDRTTQMINELIKIKSGKIDKRT